jgi:probable HAF family extracellular repeat protein
MRHTKGAGVLNPEQRSFAAAVLAFCLLAQAGLRGIASALTAQSATASSSSRPAPRYEVVDLGVVARIAADVTPGLSPSGKVVTWRQGDSQTFTAVLYEGKTQKPLPPPVGYRNSFAYSVNDRGNAAGWSNTTLNPVDSASTVHATLFTRDRALDLGTLGGLRSRAYAINDSDVVVGVSELKDREQCAFRYADGTMNPLQPLAGGVYSVAFDVNNAGVIVGGSGMLSTSTKPVVHAVLWRGNTPQDLGTLGDRGNSIAYAVNNHDDVVGVSDLGSQETVFFYTSGKMSDLGIRGHAFAINDQRQIVGTVAPEERGRPHGFLWENGTLIDINTLIPADTYRIEAAYRINNRGQILCTGFGNGPMHALLLNPINGTEKGTGGE